VENVEPEKREENIGLTNVEIRDSVPGDVPGDVSGDASGDYLGGTANTSGCSWVRPSGSWSGRSRVSTQARTALR